MRVVSLVPSATETLRELGVDPVACTRFCEQPGIATIGGTKDPRVDEIVALAPDVVVVNDEENRYDDAARLVDAGLAVHSMSPRSVVDVGPAVRALAAIVRVEPPAPFAATEWERWLDAEHAARPSATLAACTFVWRRPWTSLARDTYGSSVLELCGLENALPDVVERYPVVTLEEVAALSPAVVVLPDEPYPFGPRHVAELTEVLAGVRALTVDGRDLFWWGTRTPRAVARLRAAIRGSDVADDV